MNENDVAVAALSAQPQPLSAEDRFEQFVQAEIARSPEPLRELGEYLGRVLDEDQFPAANRLLLQLATLTPKASAPVGVDEAVCTVLYEDGFYPREEAITAAARRIASLAQQPAAVDEAIEPESFKAAFFVSKSGNRIEQLTDYSDYRTDGAALALKDLGQKRASHRGLTKKGAGKVVLASVRGALTRPQGEG